MKRPISINVIALWFFWGAAIDFRALLLYPYRTMLVTVLGLHLTRFAAICAYLALLQIRVFLGIGLLGLKPWARRGAIICCLYSAFNGVITFVMPGSFERFLAGAERTYPGVDFSGPAMMILRAGHVLSLVAGVSVSLVVLYFLITRRAPFYETQPPSSSPVPSSGSTIPSSDTNSSGGAT